MDTSGFEDGDDGTAQAEGTAGGAGGYWPPDQAMRLAVQSTPQHQATGVVDLAGAFYAFVQGTVDIKASFWENGNGLETSVLRDASEIALTYADKAQSGGKDEVASAAKHIAQLIMDRVPQSN